MKFTGRQFIPGQTSKRIEQDHLERYKFAAQFVKDKSVLDIACGVGWGTKFLKEAGAKSVDGVDILEEAINFARDNYSAENINYFVADAVKYLPNKKYDVIASLVTVEQVHDPITFLNNLYKLLDEKGVLVVSTCNRTITSPRSVGWFNDKEFTIKELSEELGKCGFKIHGTYGQRFQKHFKNRYLMRIYKILFKPDLKNSPVLTEIKPKLEPRYFTIVATKT